jgi:sulfite exporter TauE/SafE
VTLGATFGAVGQAGLVLAQGPLSRVMPWLMAAGLIASAFELGKRWPPLPGFARIPRWSARMGERFSLTSRALLRGAVTPFLPCGLIYGAFLAALGTGSPLSGGLLMGAFALGGLPALAVVQSQLPRLGASRARLLPFLRRAVPVLAAAVVVWRALVAGPEGAPHCHGGVHMTDAASTHRLP